jgi:hypothetical protein
MLKLELIGDILYTEGVPAFRILPNGEKDWIVPDGAVMYMNNKEFVDEWLKNRKKILPA